MARNFLPKSNNEIDKKSISPKSGKKNPRTTKAKKQLDKIVNNNPPTLPYPPAKSENLKNSKKSKISVYVPEPINHPTTVERGNNDTQTSQTSILSHPAMENSNIEPTNPLIKGTMEYQQISQPKFGVGPIRQKHQQLVLTEDTDTYIQFPDLLSKRDSMSSTITITDTDNNTPPSSPQSDPWSTSSKEPPAQPSPMPPAAVAAAPVQYHPTAAPDTSPSIPPDLVSHITAMPYNIPLSLPSTPTVCNLNNTLVRNLNNTPACIVNTYYSQHNNNKVPRDYNIYDNNTPNALDSLSIYLLMERGGTLPEDPPASFLM